MPSTTLADNKVGYGLDNVYYAKATYDPATSKYTYATPVRLSGGVSLDLTSQAAQDIFYADNIKYFVTDSNPGYQGDLELALVSDAFKKDILGETVVNGVLVENADTTTSEFALLFEGNGDAKKRRYALYRCKATRPNITGKTTEDKAVPNSEKLTLEIMPRENDHDIKGVCYTGDTPYDNWFTAVFQPRATV